MTGIDHSVASATTDPGTLLPLLKEFLSYPLDDGTEILDRFAALPSAIRGQGDHPMERFVYVPGTRKDRILLMVHVDTVWDRHYDNVQSQANPVFQSDRVISGIPAAGIGADDRSGCALLWHFRNSGHSLLLLDGEEKGHYAAKYLVRQHKRLIKQFNAHRYIMALDFPGGRIAHYHGVHNSSAFHRFIHKDLGCRIMTIKRGSDLSYLCRGACGVNLGVGYHSAHTPREFLSIPQWLDSAKLLEELLLREQKRYRTRKLPRLLDLSIRYMKLVWSFIRKRILKK